MFDVITIGTATRDIFITSKSYHSLKNKETLKKLKIHTGEALCFGLGSKFEINEPILTTGGDAANAAVTFSRMGLEAAAFVKIGTDEQGDAVLNEFKKEGIEHFTDRDSKNSTDFSIIMLAKDGERTIMTFRGASQNISKDDLDYNKMRAKWAYIAPGRIPYPVLKSTIDYLYSHGVSIAINPSKALIEEGLKKLSPIIKKTKVFILNREEGSYLTGIKYNKINEIFKKLDSIEDGILVLTDGNKGSYVSDNKFIYQAGVYKEKKTIDRTGAGDAYGSGFVSTLIRLNKDKYEPAEIMEAMRIGTANSTSVIEKIGAKEGILRLSEFENDKRWNNLKIKVHPFT